MAVIRVGLAGRAYPVVVGTGLLAPMRAELLVPTVIGAVATRFVARRAPTPAVTCALMRAAI